MRREPVRSILMSALVLGGFTLLQEARRDRSQAQDGRASIAKTDAPFPSQASASKLREQEAEQRAVEVYRYFYPTISMEGIMEGGRRAGAQDNKQMMVLDANPKHLIFTANSDTPYANAIIDLSRSGPLVIEMPAGPFMGLVDDHDQSWILDLGLPGADAGKGGKYVILPPGFSGRPPAGYAMAQAKTNKISIAIRALPVEGVDAAKKALQQVRIHPLDRAAETLSFVDMTDQAIDTTPLRWEDNIAYWEKLHDVVSQEPALPERKAMYGMLATLGIEKGKPFAPDARMKGVLVRAAKTGLAQMRTEAFASDRADRVVWPDRRQGSLYFLSARDANGAYLDGAKNYRLNVPQPVPAKLFWSVTAYDAKTRSEVQTPQEKAALRSMRDTFQKNPDGSIDLFFGPKAPAGKEGQWIQTNPGQPYFLYFRIYGPEKAAFDGSWKPSDLQKAQ